MNYLNVLMVSFLCFTGLAQNDTKMEKEFQVQGEAVVRVQPDQVVLQLGVESRGEDLVATKKENSNIIAKAVSFCKEKGILEKHLQTDYIRINPRYNYNKDSTLEFYRVDQSLSVTIEKLDTYEEILTELLKIGINKVTNINFRTTELKENRMKARKLAVAAAKEKAEFLANEVGLELGAISNVSEYSASTYSGLRGQAISQNVVQNVNSASDFEGISVGMIPISASVTLTYRIK